MALLDIRHFVTPVKNRMNIVIILAVALVFAVYRTSTTKRVPLNSGVTSPVLSDDFLKELEKTLSSK